MITCGAIAQLLAINQSDFHNIIPGKIGLIKQMLNVLL